MPKITRPDTNVEGFSSDIDTGGRSVFGGSDQTNDLTANLTPEFLKGWNQEGAKPNRQWFNGAMFTTSQLVSYLFQMGIAEWNVNQEYYTNSKCTSPINGFTYVSKTGTAPSTPNPGTTDPSLDSTNWRIESMQTIGDQTIAGNKNFTGTTELDRAIVSYNDADRVFTIGTSTLDAVYEFISPGGTIVGKNSNGGYVKYVDGSQIQTTKILIPSTEDGTAIGVSAPLPSSRISSVEEERYSFTYSFVNSATWKSLNNRGLTVRWLANDMIRVESASTGGTVSQVEIYIIVFNKWKD